MTPTERELESRVGIEPLDELLAERARLVDEVAPLRALYGSFGMFDAQRKVELSKVEALIRTEALTRGTKVTEAFIEQQAHAAESYADYIAQSLEARAQWALLEDRIQAINDRINRGNVLGRYAAQEMGLAR